MLVKIKPIKYIPTLPGFYTCKFKFT